MEQRETYGIDEKLNFTGGELVEVCSQTFSIGGNDARYFEGEVVGQDFRGNPLFWIIDFGEDWWPRDVIDSQGYGKFRCHLVSPSWIVKKDNFEIEATLKVATVNKILKKYGLV